MCGTNLRVFNYPIRRIRPTMRPIARRHRLYASKSSYPTRPITFYTKGIATIASRVGRQKFWKRFYRRPRSGSLLYGCPNEPSARAPIRNARQMDRVLKHIRSHVRNVPRNFSFGFLGNVAQRVHITFETK